MSLSRVLGFRRRNFVSNSTLSCSPVRATYCSVSMIMFHKRMQVLYGVVLSYDFFW
jgi:hypothetical protein